MTNLSNAMSASHSLAMQAENLPGVFAAAFNTFDPDVALGVYESEGLLVSSPGDVTVGIQRRAALEGLTAMGIPIEVQPRHVYVADDIALLIVDWSIRGTTSDGIKVDVSSTATDVARRGADGRWRYIIDNPFGTEKAANAQPVE